MKFLIESARPRSFQLTRILQSRELHSAGLFTAASLVTGLLNYLFQVVSSRHLSALDFANLNGWFANLSLFFMVSGILQYAATFRPASQATLRWVVIPANFVALGLVWLWMVLPGILTLDRALIILAFSVLFGWLTGQVQSRLWFGVLALVNLVTSLCKLAMTWLPLATPDSLDRYALAMYASLIPALWIFSYALWHGDRHEPSASAPVHGWGAPILLSIVTPIIPQFDLVLMSHTQTPLAFAEFARVSLFYRAVYTLIFILAQWLLPRQIRTRGGYNFALPFLAGAMLLLSAALTLVSPLVAQWILHWSEPPDPWLVFLSCVEMSWLALVFLRVQAAVAGQNLRWAGFLIAALGLEAGLQMSLGFEAKTYLLFTIGAQTALLVADHVLRRSSTDFGASPERL